MVRGKGFRNKQKSFCNGKNSFFIQKQIKKYLKRCPLSKGANFYNYLYKSSVYSSFSLLFLIEKWFF